MCKDLTRDDEDDYGALRHLCDDSTACTLRYLDIAAPETVVDQSGRIRTLNEAGAVAEAVLNTFRAAEASFLVVEEEYFDLDYRSEYSAISEISFRPRETSVVRLHFFSWTSQIAPPENRTSLTDFGDMYAVVDAEVRGQHSPGRYLGYMVVRPQSPGVVGRSMITTHVVHSDIGTENQTLTPHIRTAVTEHIQLFGVALVVVGIPYMEQDGHLLRCAHVSAWQCHYSAVLRGLVQRRSTTSFHRAAQEHESYGRSYPSNGLSTQVLCTALRKFDLPPEVIDRSTLVTRREITWADSEDFKKALEQLETPGVPPHRLDAFWARSNLGSSVCRYLNSGVPVILSQDAVEHTKVVLGYLRKEDFERDATESQRQLHSELAGFIVSDDQTRPFDFESIENLVDQVYRQNTLSSVIVPLPRGLLLDGATAELAAIQMFSDLAAERMHKIDIWPDIGLDPSSEGEYREALERFAVGTESASSNAFTIRTYAMHGRDFKNNFTNRTQDRDFNRRVRLLQLPKYVWVAEVISRELRSLSSDRPVVGTLVMDASDLSPGYRRDVSVKPLLAQLPGQASLIPPVTGFSFELEDSWFKIALSSYATGRYSSANDDVMSPVRFAGRAKSVGAF